MLVELKNGETLNGHLVNCDTWMNLTLKEVVQTSPDGDKFFRLAEVYVRGNNVSVLATHANASGNGDAADQYGRSSIYGSLTRSSNWSRTSNRTSRPVEAGAVERQERITEGEGTEGEVDPEVVPVVEGGEVGADEVTYGHGASESASRRITKTISNETV